MGRAVSGINALMFYMGKIFQSIFPDPAVANAWSTGVQVMQVVVTAISAPLMDKAGQHHPPSPPRPPAQRSLSSTFPPIPVDTAPALEGSEASEP